VFFYSHANGNNNYYSFFLLPLPKKDCLFSILWAHLTQIKRLLTALTHLDAKIKKILLYAYQITLRWFYYTICMNKQAKMMQN